jgi:uncharacterized MnhB-related membrane protein
MNKRLGTAFAITFVVQAIVFLIFWFVLRDGSYLSVVYRPFFGLVEPVVRRLYGASDGNLGYVALGAAIVGTLVYSGLVVFAVALVRRCRNNAPP